MATGALSAAGVAPVKDTAPRLVQLADADEVAVIIAGRPADGGAEAPSDLYRVSVTRSPTGAPIRVGAPYNLTRSADVDERIEHIDGTRLVASLWERGACLGLLAIDFAGEPKALTEGWSSLDKAKATVTNLQRTGQSAGVTETRLLFDQPMPSLTFEQSDADQYTIGREGQPPELVVHFGPDDVATHALGHDKAAPPSIHAQTRGAQPHLAWFVDTVRDLDFVGPKKIGVAEHIAFKLLDGLRLAQQDVMGPSEVEAPTLMATNDTGKPIEVAPPPLPDDPAAFVAEGDRRGKDAWVWPPRSAKPIYDAPGPFEGQWVPMTALVLEPELDTPYFYQSWIRPDKERSFARVSVTAWDASRVKLGAVAGTREPTSTTGVQGTGKIPRRPGMMKRLVAAFNGGFQTKHGGYGMVVERRAIVPPAGDAATVATTEDGRLLFGTWPAVGEPEWRKLAPGAKMPPEVYSLRQNLDPLVENGVFNPTRRRKWGSVAGLHVEDTRTTRTGICLLPGGAAAYFFGNSVSAEILGKAMLAFHCVYGVHLDMNAGHSGFEFYRVEDDEGEDFEARRMIEKMWHMNYPRYIKRDFRDFFYLTLPESPHARLGRQTELSWAPASAKGEGALKPFRPPRQVLEAQLELPGADAPVQLTRVPRAGLAMAQRPLESPSDDSTMFLRVAPPELGETMRFDLGGGVSVPAYDLSAPLPTLAEGATHLIVLAVCEVDVIVATISPDQAEAYVAWLARLSPEQIVALPTDGPDRAGLRFTNQKGQDFMRGAHTGGVTALQLTLPAARPFAHRLEPLFEESKSANTKGREEAP